MTTCIARQLVMNWILEGMINRRKLSHVMYINKTDEELKQMATKSLNSDTIEAYAADVVSRFFVSDFEKMSSILLNGFMDTHVFMKLLEQSSTPLYFESCHIYLIEDDRDGNVKFHSFALQTPDRLEFSTFSMTVGNITLRLQLTYGKYMDKDMGGNVILFKLLYATCIGDDRRFNADSNDVIDDLNASNLYLNDGDSKSLSFIDICHYNVVRFGYVSVDAEGDEEVESASVYFDGSNDNLKDVVNHFIGMISDRKNRIDREISVLRSLTKLTYEGLFYEY